MSQQADTKRCPSCQKVLQKSAFTIAPYRYGGCVNYCRRCRADKGFEAAHGYPISLIHSAIRDALQSGPLSSIELTTAVNRRVDKKLTSQSIGIIAKTMLGIVRRQINRGSIYSLPRHRATTVATPAESENDEWFNALRAEIAAKKSLNPPEEESNA